MPSIINALTAAGGGVAISGDATGNLALQTAGTTAVTVDTSQNSTFAGNVLGTASTFQVGVNTSGKDTRFGVLSGGNGRVEFYSAGSEAMRITTAGIAQINTTAAAPSIGVDTKLMVKGGDGVIECYSNSNGASYYGITFKNNNANNSGIQGTVFINSTSVTYSSLSDYRFKENVAPMKGALDKVKLLKPVTYTWKSSGEHGQGFLAHELQEVVPDCVVGEKDAVNEDGSPKGQQVDTSFLVATLTAAIQEQQVQIEELKAEVQALKGGK